MSKPIKIYEEELTKEIGKIAILMPNRFEALVTMDLLTQAINEGLPLLYLGLNNNPKALTFVVPDERVWETKKGVAQVDVKKLTTDEQAKWMDWLEMSKKGFVIIPHLEQLQKETLDTLAVHFIRYAPCFEKGVIFSFTDKELQQQKEDTLSLIKEADYLLVGKIGEGSAGWLKENGVFTQEEVEMVQAIEMGDNFYYERRSN